MDRIIQIMPAEGWRTLYVEGQDDDGEAILFTGSLVAWALIEGCDEEDDGQPYTFVVGLHTDVYGGIESCSEASNFVCYVGPEEDPEKVRPIAEEHLRST